MKTRAFLAMMGVPALVVAGCGGSSPSAGEAVPLEGAEGVVIQEEWPDEVKQAEAAFQQSAAETARSQGR
ncbi:hypothetical protein [Tautonia sociabilis]|uniref:Secreted protein n=1 Tax=Tautonia sociabilis TaxID=2080755 RepID=A0A432MEB3_9BACT|nr:hypothetical protein [Tautonia sociabilis]RUL83650.1 hypothetical protein TsocGM_21695 [Tautonia sociabilis]